MTPGSTSNYSHLTASQRIADVLNQIGMPPSRIDIMTSVTGLDFNAAWPNRVMATFGDVLGLDDIEP